MNRVLVVAPHADDESLGCGGTLLKHIEAGDEVHWLLVTGVRTEFGYAGELVERRVQEIDQVAKAYGFHSVHQLGFRPANLDAISLGDLIAGISNITSSVAPQVVYTAYRNDIHTDHGVVFDAVMSATKSFRYPSVRRVLAYETLSETDFGLKPEDPGFRPNVFVDIEDSLQRKLNILRIYSSEMGEFPFPRSAKAVEALSAVRGVQCGCKAAEAFMLVKEIVK